MIIVLPLFVSTEEHLRIIVLVIVVILGGLWSHDVFYSALGRIELPICLFELPILLFHH